MAMTINEQNLAQLLPVLQQLPAFNQPVNNERESELSLKKKNHSWKFSTTDLLTKKKKSTKSSEAQSSMSYAIRSSAKTAGLWDSAPYLQNVSPQSMDVFFDMIFNNCPQLKEDDDCTLRQYLRSRLSETLMNRRAHLIRKGTIQKQRAILIKPPTPKDKSCKQKLTPDAATVHTRPLGDTNSTAKVEHLDNTDSTARATIPEAKDGPAAHASQIGCTVEVLFKESVIAEGVLHSIGDMFSSVALTRCNEVEDEINLWVPCDEKYYFNELETNDIVEWKTKQLRVKDTKVLLSDTVCTTAELDELESTKKSQELESKRPKLSDYERERAKRIESNKKAHQIALEKRMKELRKEEIEAQKENSRKQKKKGNPPADKKKKKQQQSTARVKEQGTMKSSKFWKYAEIDSDEEEILPVLVEGKRKRKPNKQFT